MTARFKTIALFGRPQTDGLADILDQISGWLKRRGPMRRVLDFNRVVARLHWQSALLAVPHQRLA